MKKIIIIFPFLFSLFLASSIFAQTPNAWQQNATGLRTQNNTDKKTGGLGFIVQQQDWPFLSLRGGVEDANTWMHHYSIKSSLKMIELGQVKIPNTSSTFSSETADWAHNEMLFNANTPSQVKLITSRLTPAVLIQTQASAIRLFAGNVSGNSLINNEWNIRVAAALPTGPRSPKYAGTSSGILSLNNSLASIPAGQNWLLLWYGTDSHFIDTKNPLSYEAIPATNAWQADSPLLLIFKNYPLDIGKSTEGGVEITFNGPADSLVLLPLFGREILRASDTENWKNGLPADVLSKINFWSNRLCSFPLTVSENYDYQISSDTTIITENLTFTPVCDNPGITFAPLPSFLAIVKDTLGVNFSGSVTNGNLPTEYGPTMGIENMASYTWSVTGLSKYIDSQRISNNTGNPPTQLTQELNREVEKLLSGGHFRPWIFTDSVPRSTLRGALYWANPADILQPLIEIIPEVSDSTLKTNLVNYLKSERNNYPPEDIFDLDIHQGTLRKAFTDENNNTDFVWSSSSSCTLCQKTKHLKRVGLYNFYSLANYYQLTKEIIPTNLITKATTALDKDMIEQDWTTGYWFDEFQDRRIAVININRHLAGLIGLIRLTKATGASQTENLARTLFTKAIVTRLAMTKYPRYLYSSNLVELPTNPDWMAKYLQGGWRGDLINYSWTNSLEDARQVALLNQFKTTLYETSGFFSYGGTQTDWSLEFEPEICSPELIAFKNLVPELGRLLTDFNKQDTEIFIKKVEALWPHWYASFIEGTLGQEHNLMHPTDSFQIFMAKTWIQNETPENLTKFLDNPWLNDGSDLFYLQKLAETIKAYRGWTWSDTPSSTPGDLNQDTKVDILDLREFLFKFLQGLTIFDYSKMVENFGL